MTTARENQAAGGSCRAPAGMTRRRFGAAALTGLLASEALAQATPAQELAGFTRLAADLWPEAEAAGVSRATFEAAFRGLSPDAKVLALTRRQGEFSRSIRDYVEGAVSPARLQRGRELSGRWARVFEQAEALYGVPRSVVLALWGMESEFGRGTGGFQVVRSLATLASAGYRGDLFRRELVAALLILEREKLRLSALTGSWAGAMGQPQFMPSSFLAHAADGDGDGRRDIWRSEPDVIASIANFMAQSGWRRGLPWGVEVRLPAGLDLSMHHRDSAEWTRLGLRAADNRAMPASGAAQLYFPAGIGGPAFLLTENFEAIRAYNTSDAYAMAVGRLSDRLAGGGPLSRPWPASPVLTLAERQDVHRRLAALGLYAGTPDGKFGAQTRDAVRRFQLARRMVADGYAGPEVLAALRAEP